MGKSTRICLSVVIGFLLAVFVNVFVGPAHLLSAPGIKFLVLVPWLLYSVVIWLMFSTTASPLTLPRILKSLGVGGFMIGIAVFVFMYRGHSINVAGAVFVWLLASGIILEISKTNR